MKQLSRITCAALLIASPCSPANAQLSPSLLTAVALTGGAIPAPLPGPSPEIGFPGIIDPREIPEGTQVHTAGNCTALGNLYNIACEDLGLASYALVIQFEMPTAPQNCKLTAHTMNIREWAASDDAFGDRAFQIFDAGNGWTGEPWTQPITSKPTLPASRLTEVIANNALLAYAKNCRDYVSAVIIVRQTGYVHPYKPSPQTDIVNTQTYKAPAPRK